MEHTWVPALSTEAGLSANTGGHREHDSHQSVHVNAEFLSEGGQALCRRRDGAEGHVASSEGCEEALEESRKGLPKGRSKSGTPFEKDCKVALMTSLQSLLPR